MHSATHSRSSALLDSLGWVEHAFLPAGERPAEHTAFAHQRHTATVVLDAEAFPPKSHEADGVISITTRPVAVYTADCLPILIADTRQRHVAAVHAGLKGALAGVIGSAVERLLTLGATADSLYAAIGPAIGPCCYELGRDVLDKMQENPRVITPTWQEMQPLNPHAVRPQACGNNSGVWFDLAGLGRQMLQQAGIPARQIDVLEVCTYCMAEPNASYRRNTHFNHGYASRFSWIGRRD
ncbi:polyphenol oxidase family protein [Paramixta manurensis]|uniref:Polyphenol oxidase family protein n=1 Tax=Paramixta manurensis TaxID=2740817 RepID=A0A6M8UPA0_9GAMM|nr:polyphenol oxidase family protein [Erwiniaceae bacterium PD-1]